MNKCLVAWQTNRNFNNNKQYDCVEFLQSLFEHFWKEHNKLILLYDSQITEDIVFDQDMSQNSYVAAYTRI
jgi:hypothetical protein